jgi:uncharacterized protein (TIGR02145 family)
MKSPTPVTTTATNGVSNTDGTGFNALLVGSLDSGYANVYGTNTYLWSGSAGSATVAWRWYLIGSFSGAARTNSNKYYSFSVRCKK